MSASLSALRFCTGIGGSTGRPLPRSRPVFIVAMNSSTVQSPRPVSLSGVRLRVKTVPIGEPNAVKVPEMVATHGPGGSVGAGGITASSGWPLSARVMSHSGPFGPIFMGV